MSLYWLETTSVPTYYTCEKNTQRYGQAIITAKISNCRLKSLSETHSALQQPSLQLEKQSARMSLWMRPVEPRRCALGITHTMVARSKQQVNKIHSTLEQRRSQLQKYATALFDFHVDHVFSSPAGLAHQEYTSLGARYPNLSSIHVKHH